MRTQIVRLLLFINFFFVAQRVQGVSPWTYDCVNGVCVKSASSGGTVQSLNVCKMFCDAFGAIWPRPSGTVQILNELVEIDVSSISIRSFQTPTTDIAKLINGLQAYTLSAAQNIPPVGYNKTVTARPLEIVLNITDQSVIWPVMDMDESYKLTVSTPPTGAITVTIDSTTYFGGRHGVETLLQLIVWSDLDLQILMPKTVTVNDGSTYTHRGFLLDTSRNYFSVSSIKRTIEAMALVKLNTFHWHITDTHSFPLVLESKPEMSQLGAYSPEKIYTRQDVEDIVEFARIRGVRVIPEFDAPAHVGEGWQFGDADNMTVCFRAEPWSDYCVEPPCGQLNPFSAPMYDVVEGIFVDMLKYFHSDVFHMGGDEVNLNCWNTSDHIIAGLANNGYGRTKDELLRLWSDFQQKALDKLTIANNGTRLPAILWTNGLTEGDVTKYLDSGNYIIQIWTTGTDNTIKELLENDFKVILSNYDALYLDCGYGGWVSDGNNWCSPYKGWQKLYENRPKAILSYFNIPSRINLVLGGEAALWSEQVDEQALDGKTWPRLAALAERLWSDPDETWQAAETRMIHVRERLVQRGIQADSLQPQWCHQNEGKCII